MAIINLAKRITKDIQEYEDNKRSARSLIYVNEDIQHDICSPEVLILTVGESYYRKSQQISISEKGLIIKPGESVLLETKQEIATPLNVIGIIYGIGTNIYQNGFISSGKIDQGYFGHLKIGFYNGGTSNITFKKGDVLASAIFHSTEETLSAAFKEQPYERSPSYMMTKGDYLKLFISEHWISLLSLIAAVIALVVDFAK